MKINQAYAIVVLSEILFERNLINESTLKAIKRKMQSKKSHNLQSK